MSRIKVSAFSFFVIATLLMAGKVHSEESSKVVLFDGKDLSQWQQPAASKWIVAKAVSLDKANPHNFVVEPGQGIFLNSKDKHGPNLRSVFEHGDCEAHIEFCVSSNSNSGVYLQGRYEVQILDSWGVEHPKYGDCGGIYQRWKDNEGYEGHAPQLNASKRPGEWQTFDITFRAPRFDATGKKTENARFVKVVHNGKLIHENVEVTGPTRSPAFEKEGATGPIVLQGDHGPVAFRNLWIRPLK